MWMALGAGEVAVCTELHGSVEYARRVEWCGTGQIAGCCRQPSAPPAVRVMRCNALYVGADDWGGSGVANLPGRKSGIDGVQRCSSVRSCCHMTETRALRALIFCQVWSVHRSLSFFFLVKAPPIKNNLSVSQSVSATAVMWFCLIPLPRASCISSNQPFDH